jgi:hypothetical protein
VIFDKHVFPFVNLPSSQKPPVMESSLLPADQFMDIAYAPSLLVNHGAGIGRGTQLEILTPEDAAPSKNSGSSLHVDHAPLHGSLSESVLLHGSFPMAAPCLPPPGSASPRAAVSEVEEPVTPTASSTGSASPTASLSVPGIASPSLHVEWTLPGSPHRLLSSAPTSFESISRATPDAASPTPSRSSSTSPESASPVQPTPPVQLGPVTR